MDANNLFVRATRENWTFPAQRESLAIDFTVQQLWTLPLVATGNRLDLDTVARQTNAALRALGEESFVETENPKRELFAAKLDLVKFIIATKQAEAKAKVEKSALEQERQEILSVMREKDLRDLSQASKEDLQTRLANVERRLAS